MNSNVTVTEVLEQVTRWDAPSSSCRPEDDGDLVLYDDAIWAATVAYQQGQRDMLAKAITAVADRVGNKAASWRASDQPSEDYFVAIVDAVAALRALLEGEKA